MRRSKNVKRKLIPDPKYNDETLAKFINYIMLDGKKSVARSVVYKTLEEIKRVGKESDPVAVFHTAISNVSPMLEVKSRRVGGANYQIPCEVKGERRTTLAMRWILNAVKSKKGKSISKHLANEILLAYKKEGDAMKKREDTHKMAEANKAFAHFAW